MLLPTSPDFAAVADAIYDLESEPCAWLARVFGATSKSFQAPDGMMGIQLQSEHAVMDAGAFDAQRFLLWGSDPSFYRTRDFARFQPPGYFPRRTSSAASSDYQLFGDEYESLPHIRWGRRRGFSDVFVLNGLATHGSFATACFALPVRCGTLPRGLVAEWECVAEHLGLGAKLRRRPLAPEAVVRLDGALVDGTGGAHAERALLRDLVRRLMRSRGSYRDRENPLAARRAGRWTLVDRFESDGRHVILAHTAERAPTPLSTRERRVAELLARGCSHKEIAEQLDVSIGAVASYGHRVFRKLDVKGRVELARALGR